MHYLRTKPSDNIVF